MNTNPQILPLHPEPASASPPSAQAATLNPQPGASPAAPRRRGKIARLPRPLRERLNELLYDGVLSYKEIRETLGPDAKDITDDNISEWVKGGHQDWLREKFWREEMRARFESFTDLLADTDPVQISQAGLLLSIMQICEQLRDLSPGAHKQTFEQDTNQYLRMVNSLSRLSKSLLALQQHREAAAAKSAAFQLKRQDPKRAFAEAERQAFLDRADELFGFKSPAPLQQEMAPTAGSAGVPPAGCGPVPGPVEPPPPLQPPAENHLPVVAEPVPPAEPAREGSPCNPTTPSPEDSSAAAPSSPPHNSTTPSLQHSSAATPSSRPKPTPGPGHCPACKILQPPLLKNGERPIPRCPKCGSPLYDGPSWTPFEAPWPNGDPTACDMCRQRHQLDPNGLPDPCPTCGFYLLKHPPINNSQPPPDPGHCDSCRLALPPLLRNGERAVPYCPHCGSRPHAPPAWTPFDAPLPKGPTTTCALCRQRHQLDPYGLPDPCSQCGYYRFTHPVAQPQPQ